MFEREREFMRDAEENETRFGEREPKTEPNAPARVKAREEGRETTNNIRRQTRREHNTQYGGGETERESNE